MKNIMSISSKASNQLENSKHIIRLIDLLLKKYENKIPNDLINAMHNLNEEINSILIQSEKNDKFTLYDAKILQNELLHYFKYSLNLMVLEFWSCLNTDNVIHPDPKNLIKVLTTKKLPTIEMWIDLQNNFNEIIASEYVQENLDENEVISIKNILQEEMANRVKYLSRVLYRKGVRTNYLKFTETFALLNNTGLLVKTFNEDEIAKLKLLI